MSRYIDADHLIKRATDVFGDYWASTGESTADFVDYINEEPTAEVKPIVYGKWIEHKNVEQANGETVYECSNCGVYSRKEFFCEKNFCPNCGAKMKGEEEE